MKTIETAKKELNANEFASLVSLIDQVVACTGNEFGFTGDAVTPAAMTRNQFKGYISDLVKKGYITSPYTEYSGQYELLFTL